MIRVPKEIQSWAPSAKFIWYVLNDNGWMTKQEIRHVTRVSYQTIEHYLSSLQRVELVGKAEVDGEVQYRTIKNGQDSEEENKDS